MFLCNIQKDLHQTSAFSIVVIISTQKKKKKNLFNLICHIVSIKFKQQKSFNFFSLKAKVWSDDSGWH